MDIWKNGTCHWFFLLSKRSKRYQPWSFVDIFKQVFLCVLVLENIVTFYWAINVKGRCGTNAQMPCENVTVGGHSTTQGIYLKAVESIMCFETILNTWNRWLKRESGPFLIPKQKELTLVLIFMLHKHHEPLYVKSHGWLWLRRQSRSSTNPRVGGAFPCSSRLHAGVSLDRIPIPQLPLMYRWMWQSGMWYKVLRVDSETRKVLHKCSAFTIFHVGEKARTKNHTTE